MDVKASIVKRGKDAKRTWWARVIYVDPETGKLRDLQRRAPSKVAAGDLRDSLKRELEKTHGGVARSKRKTFNDLCDYFEKHYVKAAEYVHGEKVAGVRSLATAQVYLKTVREHFGPRILRSITYGDLRAYRSARLQEPTRGDIARHQRELKRAPKQKLRVTRAIASVNRELSMLRRMFNVALDEGWIPAGPFKHKDTLINTAAEKKRERILTRGEELQLLAACDKPRRQHLKAIITCALDTGMRRGEIFSLRWEDVNFLEGVLNIKSFNTKTMKARQVAMTARLMAELEQLRAWAPDDASLRVFGINDNVKRSFTAARGDAGLKDVRFHDLRHTAASRLVSMHIPLSEVGRVLGHTQANTDIQAAARS